MRCLMRRLLLLLHRHRNALEIRRDRLYAAVQLALANLLAARRTQQMKHTHAHKRTHAHTRERPDPRKHRRTKSRKNARQARKPQGTGQELLRLGGGVGPAWGRGGTSTQSPPADRACARVCVGASERARVMRARVSPGGGRACLSDSVARMNTCSLLAQFTGVDTCGCSRTRTMAQASERGGGWVERQVERGRGDEWTILQGRRIHRRSSRWRIFIHSGATKDETRRHQSGADRRRGA
jgi:hypothetical protein